MRFCLFICVSLYGAATGRLEGTVRDSSDGVMPGASISCIQEETGFRFSRRADLQGSYRMLVPERHYKVIASQAGFRGVVEIGVFVANGRTQRVDFQLAPDSVSDAATVSDSTTEIPSVSAAEDGAIVMRPDAPGAVPQNDRTITGMMQITPGM